MDNPIEIIHHDISQDYKIGHSIGSGSLSKVKEATNIHNNKHYAIKIIDLKHISEPDAKKILLDYLFAWSRIKSPHILKYEAIYEKENILQIVCELMSCDILSHLSSKGPYSEAHAAEFVKTITLGFRDYHLSTGRALGCLKPENVLYHQDENGEALKLDIFSVTTILPKTQSLKEVDSSDIFFVSPEKLNGENLEIASDIWSVGVMTYLILCGYPPFYDDNIPAGLESIRKVKFDFPEEDWSIITTSAEDLISNLLKLSPQDRYSTEMILQSSWMTAGGSTEILPPIIQKRLEKFRLTKMRAITDAVLLVNKLIKTIGNN